VKITGHASTDVVRVFLNVVVLENNGENGQAALLLSGLTPTTMVMIKFRDLD
jgi:hypothetical protein